MGREQGLYRKSPAAGEVFGATRIGAFSAEHPVVFVLAAIALLAISAQVVIPVGPVPFTMQVFAMAFIAAAFPLDRALETVGGYVAAGALGAPVFAGLKGGAVTLLGPTGGFIWGMIPGVIVACLTVAALKMLPAIRRNEALRFAAGAAAGILCTAVMYLCGCVQFSLLFGADVATTLAVCVTPFILPDLAKITLAAFVAVKARLL